MSEWKSIDTAPYNEDILLFSSDGVYQGYFEEKIYQGNKHKILNVLFLPEHGCGCCSETGEKPTHWMPLPQPPKEN